MRSGVVMLGSTVRRFVLGALFCAMSVRASAEFSIYDTKTYDYQHLGVPKFVNTNYIDLNKVTAISKYRSFAGHDYSDQIQFGNSGNAIKVQFKPTESCVNLKHYFRPPDANTVIRAPVSGVISRVFEEEFATQIHITSDVQPAFTFFIFHVVTPTPVSVGMRVEEGQVLGHHYGQTTDSDIAVAVHDTTGYHLISYFETLTDELFAQFQARGIATRDQMIIPRAVADAIPNRCAKFTNGSNDDDQFVKLTGGAATQTITFATPVQTLFHPGDTFTVNATASSGLPVTMTTNAPKTCSIEGLTATFRRAGTCLVGYTQNGDANTFPARTYFYNLFVVPAGQDFPDRPKLGAVFPPSATAQSFLRFTAGYLGGTVSLTLTDADTGIDKIHWTSPMIAGSTSPQFAIADIEATAPAGYQRPAMYGVRIEASTTLTGTLQHVLYNPSRGTLSNVTACHSGLGTPPFGYIGNVHTSKLTGYPSTIVYHNSTPFDFLNVFIHLFDASTGVHLNYFTRDVTKLAPGEPVMPVNSGAILPISDLERLLKITPTSSHYTAFATAAPSGAFFQHLVTNSQTGVIADMTAVCNLSGGAIAAPGIPVRGGALFGAGLSAGLSFLRFYNSGATAGPVKVTLYDMTTGANLGQWTSPMLAPGVELQTPVGTLEKALGTPQLANYDFRIDTDIDGFFQHVVWNTTASALTNLSTCKEGVGAEPFAAIGVHSSLVAGQGYPSLVNVMNTGSSAQSVQLSVYDAGSGVRIGGFQTRSIPGGGQLLLDSAAIEAGATLAPNAAIPHYIVKADPFTGFLQHLVNNISGGVVTDMTAGCAM